MKYIYIYVYWSIYIEVLGSMIPKLEKHVTGIISEISIQKSALLRIVESKPRGGGEGEESGEERVFLLNKLVCF